MEDNQANVIIVRWVVTAAVLCALIVSAAIVTHLVRQNDRFERVQKACIEHDGTWYKDVCVTK